MHVKIAAQFAADLKQINDVSLQEKLQEVLKKLKATQHIESCDLFKPIEGNTKAYKMNIGFYYVIGYASKADQFMLIRLLSNQHIIKILQQ